MRKLDPNRYYKLVGLCKSCAWADRPTSSSIIGAILRPVDIHTSPSRRDKRYWTGRFEVIKRSQWDRPNLPSMTMVGAKLRLIPRSQMEKIDENARHK